MTEPVLLVGDAVGGRFRDIGRVVVLRAAPRGVGRTSWTTTPNGPARGEVIVSEIGVVETDADVSLRPYRPLSAFSTLGAWRDALRERHGGLPETAHLYYVARPADD